MSNLSSYKFHFDPCAQSQEELKQCLMGLEPNNAYRYGDKLLVWTGKDIKEIDVSKVPDSTFLNKSKRSDLEGLMAGRFRTYNTHI